jgi:hypothetical protein
MLPEVHERASHGRVSGHLRGEKDLLSDYYAVSEWIEFRNVVGNVK